MAEVFGKRRAAASTRMAERAAPRRRPVREPVRADDLLRQPRHGAHGRHATTGSSTRNNWLFTARGIPVIYYGSETGFSAARAEHAGNRNYFGQERVDAAPTARSTRQLQRIAKLRAQTPALQRGLQVNVRAAGRSRRVLPRAAARRRRTRSRWCCSTSKTDRARFEVSQRSARTMEVGVRRHDRRCRTRPRVQRHRGAARRGGLLAQCARHRPGTEGPARQRHVAGATTRREMITPQALPSRRRITSFLAVFRSGHSVFL